MGGCPKKGWSARVGLVPPRGRQVSDIFFDCAIDLALEKLDEADVYDLSVTRFDDGAPQDIINIDDYVTENDEVTA